MKKSKRMTNVAFAVLLSTNIFWMTGCGETESVSPQTDTAVQYEISEEPRVNLDEQDAADTAKIQDSAQEKGAETGSIMRSYSDQEKERMAELQQSYQNETIYPENLILEVESAEAVTEGTLCYIKSTGEYYLPERELTDEELLEIIDCNFRIALNTNRPTQDQIDEENLAERVVLEGKVQAADGISEEKAIEIAKQAMEADIGNRGEKLKLRIDESYGWSTSLDDITDWDEYKDRGEIAYFVQFDNGEDGMNLEDMTIYICVVNAVDGSILDAYEIVWDESGSDIVYYKH